MKKDKCATKWCGKNPEINYKGKWYCDECWDKIAGDE